MIDQQQVTPEMIEAGLDELYFADCCAKDRLVELIYLAMKAASEEAETDDDLKGTA